MFYVYILKSRKDNKIYIGYTNDLRRRKSEHDAGESQSTKGRRPLDLIYYEAYLSKEDAMKREVMLKKGSRTLGGLKRRISQSLHGRLV